MANNASGLITRERIIEAARRLFYEKGYIATTYNDICEAVDIKQGNLHYHFKSKELLCREVLAQHLQNNYEDAKQFINEDDLFLSHILSAYIFWYKFFNDENYRRFANETVMEYSSSGITEYFRRYFESISTFAGEPKQHSVFDMVSCAAVEASLPKFMFDNLEGHTYEELAEYNNRIYGVFLGPDKKYMDEAIRKSVEIMHTADLSKIKFEL